MIPDTLEDVYVWHHQLRLACYVITQFQELHFILVLYNIKNHRWAGDEVASRFIFSVFDCFLVSEVVPHMRNTWYQWQNNKRRKRDQRLANVLRRFRALSLWEGWRYQWRGWGFAIIALSARENYEPPRDARWNVGLILMSRKKCNFHDEERTQVWGQIRNGHNEEDESLDDL